MKTRQKYSKRESKCKHVNSVFTCPPSWSC